MKNIHVLPTDKPSRLSINCQTGLLQLGLDNRMFHDDMHIYITSDEEIKVGDWFLPQGHINPHKLKEYNKINGDLESYNGLCYDISKCKKIILTTDQDLIKDGVQAIDDDFLEWFVKNPSCEEVEVDFKYKNCIPDLDDNGNKILRIKIPSKSENLSQIIPKEEPKQETLEEVAERYYEENIDQSNIPREHYEIEIKDLMIGFAYKWQQEQDKNKYSEEEVRRMFDRYNEVIAHRNIEEWQPWIDKQFKKK